MLVHIPGSSHPHYQGLACHTHSLHELHAPEENKDQSKCHPDLIIPEEAV